MSDLGNDAGFWPGAPAKVKYQPDPNAPKKEPKVREPKQKVELNPYKPRKAPSFEVLSDEELVEAVGDTLVFDVECFKNYFLIAFKHLKTGKFLLFEIPFDGDKLEWVLINFTCVGFNSLRYDMPLVWMARSNQDMIKLKKVSDELIRGEFVTNITRRHKISILKTKHIDLIEVCPMYGSLKLYGARLHAERILELPWSDLQELEKWQISVTRHYCLDDLNLTELVFNNLTEQLQLRAELTKEQQKDLMSKSDAQIAEAVIGNEIKKIKNAFPSRPKIKPGSIFKFKTPKNLKFQTKYMKDILKTVEGIEFVLEPSGYLGRPEIIDTVEITIGNSIYRMGMGGLHSSESRMALVADAKHDIIDRDVASYYPAIVMNCGLYPKNLGPEFLQVYKSLIERRLAAKKAGNIAVSENLKISINGTFGKTGNPYSILYAPEVIIQILLGGQLYLLMLIEALELGGVPVASANTDGILMYCPKSKKNKADQIISQWEKTTNFVTEETQYKAVYSRDVNAYLAIKLDGSVKGKNIFYDPWRAKNARDRFWQFQKNPNCQIAVEAVERFVVDGIPIEKTVRECKDICKFVAVKNVTGGAHKAGDYLGKTVRWYIADGEQGSINYVANNNLVPDTLGAKPVMDLPTSLPDDIDYAYYIRRAEEMLVDMGYSK